jgi:rhomboid protease GluP
MSVDKGRRKFRLSFNAPIVLGFVTLCLIATTLGVLTGGRLTQGFFMTYHSSLAFPLTYLRFFTHILGHAGWEHFFGNMMYILLLGSLLEEKYGAATMIETILITALVTALVNYIFFPYQALCGASGVVFAFILLASFTSFKEGEVPLTFILIAVFFIGQQVVEGITVSDNISNISHICGGVVGSIIGFALNKQKPVNNTSKYNIHY